MSKNYKTFRTDVDTAETQIPDVETDTLETNEETSIESISTIEDEISVPTSETSEEFLKDETKSAPIPTASESGASNKKVVKLNVNATRGYSSPSYDDEYLIGVITKDVPIDILDATSEENFTKIKCLTGAQTECWIPSKCITY